MNIMKTISLMSLLLTMVLHAPAYSMDTKPAEATDGPAKTLADYPWYDIKTEQFKPLTVPPVDSDSDNSDRKRSSASSDSSGDTMAQLLRILMWTLIFSALGILGFLIWRALSDLPPSTASDDAPKETFRKERLELLPEVVRGVTDFLGEAQAKANAGDYSLAMIYYFAWQLLMLDVNHSIELECGKTNRQYLRESSRHKQPSHPVFQISMQYFEDVLYGGILLDEDDFQSVWKDRDLFRASPQTAANSKKPPQQARDSKRLAAGGVR